MDIEVQILEYNELTVEQRFYVDSHVLVCDSCHNFQSALNEVDIRLDREFPSLQTSPVFSNRVRSRIQALNGAVRKPSPVPEVLDLVGCLSVTAAVLVTLVLLFPNSKSILVSLTLDSQAKIGAEIIVVLMAIGFGIKVYADINPDAKH
jgi:hypothetical protein